MSLTIRYNNRHGTFYKAKRGAPINKIQGIAYDLYLLLEFKNEDITWYKTAINFTEFIEQTMSNSLHIEVPWPEKKGIR